MELREAIQSKRAMIAALVLDCFVAHASRNDGV
jgi:hypothetical protein